jgi:hypothetical protein
MAYDVTNAKGEQMQLLHREWELLLELAVQYGWQSVRGEHIRGGGYGRGGRIDELDARNMAAALGRAMPDIPGDPSPHAGHEQGEALAYFSGNNLNTLRQFIQLASGAFEIRERSGFGGEF